MLNLHHATHSVDNKESSCDHQSTGRAPGALGTAANVRNHAAIEGTNDFPPDLCRPRPDALCSIEGSSVFPEFSTVAVEQHQGKTSPALGNGKFPELWISICLTPDQERRTL